MNPSGIEKQVCEDIAGRQELGVKKYGVTVADNPLSFKEWLQHIYEEGLDQVVYLKRAMMEADDPRVCQEELDYRDEQLRVQTQSTDTAEPKSWPWKFDSKAVEDQIALLKEIEEQSPVVASLEHRARDCTKMLQVVGCDKMKPGNTLIGMVYAACKEILRLRVKLRDTKRYLRAANKGAEILSMTCKISSDRNIQLLKQLEQVKQENKRLAEELQKKPFHF
jgi:hypothetical protein